MESSTKDKLIRGLEQVWDLGARFIIGWVPVEGGILLVHAPCYAVSGVSTRNPEVLRRRRLWMTQARAEELISEGCASDKIELPSLPRDDDATTEAIDTIMRQYTATYSNCRAVALFDIVKFSLNSTYDQLAQLSFLSHCINLAAKYCAEHGFPIDIRTSTTGDGFYVWNQTEGFIADQALYFVTALALAANNSVADRDHARRGVPQLRCCIGFGGHFEYRHITGQTDGATEYIVGEVTINLSRLISMAMPNQVLVASYNRHLEEEEEQLCRVLATDTIDTQTFIGLSEAIAAKTLGMPLPNGSSVAEINAYLTGSKISDREFTIKKYSVADKHGLEHRCFNLKFNVSDQSGKKIYVGLMESELGPFAAQHVKREDIRVRVA